MPVALDECERSQLLDGPRKQAPPWKPVVMQAKHITPCSYCNLPISPGNAIYPWGNYTGYMHLHCALREADEQSVELQPPICKHWSRRGYCLYKDKCFYRHPEDALPQKPASPDNSNHNAATNQARRVSNRGIGKRNLVRNAFRAGVFRRFLIETFGREALNQGSGVLDVAGGKGELSFELLNLNGINATVVEPRALQLWRQQKWMLKGFYHRNVNFQSFVDHKHQEFTSGQRTCVDPPHLRMVFDEAVVNSLLWTESVWDKHLHDKQQQHSTLQPQGPQQLQQHDSSDAQASEEVGQASSSLPQQRTSSAATLSGQEGLQGDTDQSAHDGHTTIASQQQATDCAPQQSEASGQCDAWRQVLQQSMILAKDIRWTHKGLQHESSEAWAAAETGGAEPPAVSEEADQPKSITPDTSQADNDVGATDITDLDKARSIIQDCSVLVGIHPDQAAEPIINFAQRTRRPFAMVPCCVYPIEFPRRKLPDGTWVRKYEHLIQYLQCRDPEHIHVATLPFEGRNQVVYCTSWG